MAARHPTKARARPRTRPALIESLRSFGVECAAGDAVRYGGLRRTAPYASYQLAVLRGGVDLVAGEFEVEAAAGDGEVACGAGDVAVVAAQRLGDHAAFEAFERVGE